MPEHPDPGTSERPAADGPPTALPTTSRQRRRRLLQLAIPATLTLLAEPILGVVDTAIAGRIGTVELGALGLATSLLAAVTWVFNFLVFGTTSTVARALGRGDREAAGRRVAHAAVVALALGLLAGVVAFVFATPLVRFAGAVEELVEPTAAYLRVRAIGIPFMLLGFVGHGAFRGAGDTRRPLLVVLVANLVNLALNVVLVFGLGWDLVGIASATVVAEVITAAWLAVMATRRLGLDLLGHGLPDRAQVAALAVVSRDLFLRTAGLVGGIAVITAAAARAGADVAAAHQVIWQVYLLLSFLLDGLAVASQTMLSTALGAREPRLVRATVTDALRWAVGVGVVLGVVLLVGQPWFVAVFTGDQAVVALVATAWWLPAVAMPLHSLVFVLDGLLMGAEDYRFIRSWTVAGAVLGAIMAQVGVSLGAGLLWLWISYEVVMLLRGLPLLVRARSDAWLPSDLRIAPAGTGLPEPG
ncbi:MATE family efflux transporter [Salsipaludibacter albus]|uniref:MATE family efflux transporter n=1 Tax=Salsipaludibacter albus TaxID=2849650 RepID=UPI001EE42FB6|nr:MATE family efflux transporter [Salsipaludibacter albus]MBY5161882.1 MATE family efflux transporter [Salsipaludibacter albus]